MVARCTRTRSGRAAHAERVGFLVCLEEAREVTSSKS
jgi:hypothetical protein